MTHTGRRRRSLKDWRETLLAKRHTDAALGSLGSRVLEAALGAAGLPRVTGFTDAPTNITAIRCRACETSPTFVGASATVSMPPGLRLGQALDFIALHGEHGELETTVLNDDGTEATATLSPEAASVLGGFSMGAVFRRSLERMGARVAKKEPPK